MKRIVRATAVVLALGASLTMAGCSTKTNTAAIVDGRTITLDEVTTATREINQAVDPSQPVTAAQALSVLIWAPAVIDKAAQNGFPQSDSQARSVLPMQDPDPATIRIVQYINAVDHVSAAERMEIAQHLKVTVNPRFGTFDKSKGLVAPLRPNGLTSAS